MAMDFSASGHDKGDKACDACSLAHAGFPEPHQCGGLLHADGAEEEDGAAMQAIEVGDDSVTVADIVDLCCDTCGTTGQRTMPARALSTPLPVPPVTGKKGK